MFGTKGYANIHFQVGKVSMKEILKQIHIVYIFSKANLRVMGSMGYTIWFFLVGKIVRFVFFFFFIKSLVMKTNIMPGYSVNEALVFYLAFTFLDSIVQAIYRRVYQFRQMVVSGSFDLILLKPYNPFLNILIGGIDFMDLILSIPLAAILMYHVMQVPGLGLSNYIVFWLMLLNGLIIATAFHIFVLSVGILTTSVDHAIMIYRDVTSLGRFPLDIYRKQMRFVATYIIPVGVMVAFPVYGLLDKLTFSQYVEAAAISIGLFGASILLWEHSLRYYQSAGS